MVLNREVDAQTANALLYACNVCLGAIRVGASGEFFLHPEMRVYLQAEAADQKTGEEND